MDARGFELDDEYDVPDQQDNMAINKILPTGARFYVDHAHPEFSTPECSNVFDLLRYEKAGERILNLSRLGANQLLPGGRTIIIYKNNSDQKGNMLSLPFNSSTALFYIDRNKFKQAGLPPVPPKTWKELLAVAEKLKAAGQECVYTTGWPSWVHIENFSAWHNVPIGTKQNGMGGTDTQFTINSPLHVRHVEMLAGMAKKGLFTYAGRTNQADSRFASGECAMATISAGALGGTINILTAQPAFHQSEWQWRGEFSGYAASADVSGGGMGQLMFGGPRLALLAGGAWQKHNDLRAGKGEDSRHVLRRFFGLPGDQVRELTGDRQQETIDHERREHRSEGHTEDPESLHQNDAQPKVDGGLNHFARGIDMMLCMCEQQVDIGTLTTEEELTDGKCY